MGAGGDLVTKEQFGSFELRLQWRIAGGGNSGIMFRSTEDHNSPWETGPEYQLLDDDLNPDGLNPKLAAGANYALHPRRRDVARPAGAWNDTRIVVMGDHVEHWLNGYKVVEYRLNSPEWAKMVAESKFASMPDYGRRRVGHIVLQDHGNQVAFRSIRIKKL